MTHQCLHRALLWLTLLLFASGCAPNGGQGQGSAPTAAPATMAATGGPSAAPAAAPTPAAEGATFENPVLRADFPDPAVLEVDDTFYAYATNAGGKNVQVARSNDLVRWEQLPDAMPALPKWAKLGGSFVWAPEVIQIGATFVLYYTARSKEADQQCIGVATSDKAEGRFRDTRDAPLICQTDEGGSIDASPFRDGAKLFLYWKNDGNCCNKATYLYVQELTPDGLGLVGEPKRLVRNDAPWEGNLVEAPTMVEHKGSYLLFFSANDYTSPNYAVGYATCQGPTGPCADAAENPILKSKMDGRPLVVGPGHQAIIQVGDETWALYHAWEVTSAGLRGSRRLLWLDRVVWQGGRPIIQGPTTGPQPAP